MGLIRKSVGVGTLGLGARYRNKEERAERNAKVMKAERNAKVMKAERNAKVMKKEAKKQTKLLEEIAKQNRRS
jgi:hypothetical protein